MVRTAQAFIVPLIATDIESERSSVWARSYNTVNNSSLHFNGWPWSVYSDGRRAWHWLYWLLLSSDRCISPLPLRSPKLTKKFAFKNMSYGQESTKLPSFICNINMSFCHHVMIKIMWNTTMHKAQWTHREPKSPQKLGSNLEILYCLFSVF